MVIRLHKNATTTPAIRREIQKSNLSERELAKKYGISRLTVRRWKKRDSVEDRSHRRLSRKHGFQTTKKSGENWIKQLTRGGFYGRKSSKIK